MALIRLNHDKLLELMIDARLRPCEVAKRLGVSRQMMNYILYRGGTVYAGKLARIFRCAEADLLVGTKPNALPVKKKHRKRKGKKTDGNRGQ